MSPNTSRERAALRKAHPFVRRSTIPIAYREILSAPMIFILFTTDQSCPLLNRNQSYLHPHIINFRVLSCQESCQSPIIRT